MAKLRRARAKRLVLDIGSSAIRLCELSQTKAGYQLTKYLQKEVIADPSQSEEERHALRFEALQELLKEAKIKAKQTVFGVPGQSVFVRTRALPPVPEHKVTQIVRYEIQQQIPFSLDQIALDYQVLAHTEAGGYDVVMAAIKVDVVEKHVRLVQEAKRHVHAVDVCPIAAYNWLKYTGEFGEEGECVALLDLGATTTDIVIERGGQFRMNRSLNLGGNDITAAISSEFGMSFTDAEKLKRERAIAPVGDPQQYGRGGEVIGRVLSRLVSEVNRSLAYFRSQPGGAPVSRVILTGGGACLRNMVPYLQRQLGIEVRIAQPLAGLAIAPSAQQVNERPEQAAVVLGLALRSWEDVPIEINLIPPWIRELARRRQQAFYWAASFVVLALVFLSYVPQKARANERVVKDIEELRRQIGWYDPKIANGQDPTEADSQLVAEKEAIVSELGDYRSRVQQLDNVYKNRTPWLKYLRAITAARSAAVGSSRTKGIWLTSMEAGTMGIRGAAAKASGDEAAGDDKGKSKPRDNQQDEGGRASHWAKVAAVAGGASSPATTQLVSEPGSPRPIPGIAPSAQSTLGAKGGVVTPPNPNGLILTGFGSDSETVIRFVEELKEREEFVKDGELVGVYFDQRLMNRLPRYVLEQPEFASSLAMDPAAAAGLRPEELVVSFQVALQFAGKPVDLKVMAEIERQRTVAKDKTEEDDRRDRRRR